MIRPLVASGLLFTTLFRTDVPTIPESPSDFPGTATCDVTNNAFLPGESLSYKVYYNWGALWFSGGEVYFKLQEETLDGKQVYHASGEADSYKSFDWFFKVRDRLETWMNPETLQSYKFERDVSEGGYNFYRSYDWDRENNIIQSYHDNKKGNSGTVEMKDVDPCALDLLSTFYWMRTIDLSKYKPGDKIPVSMAIDDEQYKLYVRYDGKEDYKTKLGTFHCVKLKPLLVEGAVFHSGEGMTIWLTDDENRIPVRIESQLLIGRITADLKSYAGTRHPFTSKID